MTNKWYNKLIRLVIGYLGSHQVYASDEPELADLGLDVQLNRKGTL